MEELNCGFTQGDKWFRLRAAAVIIKDGCVLAAKNDAHSYYYSVGGGIHHGETTEEAAAREAFEETGVKYEVDRLLFIHENYFKENSLDCHELTFYYLMKPNDTAEFHAISYIEGDVLEHMEWLPIKNYSDYEAYPIFFADYLENLPQYPIRIVSKE